MGTDDKQWSFSSSSGYPSFNTSDFNTATITTSTTSSQMV